MLIIVIGTFFIWLPVMFATRPSDAKKLDAFVKRVNPPGFWKPIRDRVGVKPLIDWKGILTGWGIMLMAIYGPLVGLIKIFFGSPGIGLFWLAIGITGVILAIRRARALDDDVDVPLPEGS